MIRVTIELLPFGFEERKRKLGVAEIWNDATGTKTRGNYKYRLLKAGERTAVWKVGEVKNFPRKRLGPWDLLARILIMVIGQRNELDLNDLKETEDE